MPETAMTDLAWRFDPVGPHATSSEMCETMKSKPVTAPVCSAAAPVAESFTAGGVVRRFNDLVRIWARETLKGFGGRSACFEEIVHEFTTIVETADSSGAVEAALLRQARRTVPACRVELIIGPAHSHDLGPHILNVDEGTRTEMTPSQPGDDESGQSILDVPLRCGSAVAGRLRIRSRTRGTASFKKETIRRLTTLCSIGACALERLDRREEWPGFDELANPADSPGDDLASTAARPAPAFVGTTRLHDATFLNAVLPFALNQARRHNEPISLVCVAIDRLGSIQDLLGTGIADQLVRSVADTVASLIRASDIVVRLDDDRIVAVLPRAPGGGALHVAQKICGAVAEKGRAGCEMLNITVSIGVATFPACAGNVFSLFDAADEALSRAQSHGRNQACLAPRRPACLPVRAESVSCSS
jgi:diguanylate cyclase (GGDEF)-like protein